MRSFQYAVILLVIFVLQIAIGVFAFLEINDNNDLHQKVNETLTKLFTTAQDKNQTGLVDFIQQELQCCGLDGLKPWTVPPDSCCNNKDCKQPNAKPYTDGCPNKFYDLLMDTTKVIGITVLVLSATEV